MYDVFFRIKAASPISISQCFYIRQLRFHIAFIYIYIYIFFCSALIVMGLVREELPAITTKAREVL